MNLEITGKLVALLPETTGQGKNGTWTKREFVIETADQYPKKVCISAWGDKADGLRNVKIGDEIRVAFNIESREYNERWYTDIRAWKIDRAGVNAADQAPYEPQRDSSAIQGGNGSFESFQANSGPTDDLPF